MLQAEAAVEGHALDESQERKNGPKAGEIWTCQYIPLLARSLRRRSEGEEGGLYGTGNSAL
jgi:hypothetical protein